MNILLVEDDARLGELVQYKLKKELFQVEWAQDAQTAESFIERSAFDIYILDWMLPRKSGIELCKQIRARKDFTPILMLTAKDTVTDRVQGLNAGADDYLVKPFAFEELIARIHALFRRKETNWEGEKVSLGDVLVIHKTRREVIRSGVVLSLSRREFQLLDFLADHQGQVLSREQLLDRVWGLDAEVTLNAVDATIKLLRKKLDDPFPDKLIHNVRGFGYRLMIKEDSTCSNEQE
ncbi:response regulator transcription factor [Paenibacillus sp. 32352]|uniref:response regulator transcription factor n=1 Tax=Paenibacillus sp. 32352 TaxID=1969111 RepID=UPI0009ABE316|nr:response regulator transcription factor [Paenibacillus sp. 32352]